MSRIQESNTTRTYATPHYSVLVSKNREMEPCVSFFNGVTFTGVYINRKEAAYALKKFRNNLANEKKNA
jgi:hypothetical protein